MNLTRLPAAHSRTFSARVTFQECGTVTDVVFYSVTLRRSAAGILAEVNGESVSLERAVRLLQNADRVEVTAEELLPEPAPIGKKRAHSLHKIMGRLGIVEHYRFASVSLGRRVSSLAALTEAEARRVWSDILSLYPEAAA